MTAQQHPARLPQTAQAQGATATHMAQASGSPAASAAQAHAANARLRQASRLVLQAPADLALHAQRIQMALALPGTEPLQAAVVDMLCGCKAAPQALCEVLAQPAVRERLPAPAWQALHAQAQSGQPLPRVTPLATRWCVLAAPSLDVPQRAWLCGVDDSRSIAAHALPPLQAGNAQAEQGFLAHCLGAHDTLAFMLARRALQRQHIALSPQWEQTMQALQQRMDA
ncbi:hypothetical protein [Vandammella animalimorsus]|uniref:Uncharacterized protein n=1 Tax=Vandammella animalimorsus TaxID=2029117 RepID=A0A2A2AS27_9BURK|nr:hypothetical protein [Vandammella animalimorsus]PAT40449.1 hypothetical protein CK621_13960 [Vandammella animalimorsus]